MSYTIIKDMKLIETADRYIILFRGDNNNVYPKDFSTVRFYYMPKDELDNFVNGVVVNDELYKMELLKRFEVLKKALLETKGTEKDLLKFKFRLSTKDKSIVDEWLNKYEGIEQDYYGYYCVIVDWNEVKEYLGREGVYIGVKKGRINWGVKHWYENNALNKEILTVEEIKNILLENNIDWLYVKGFKVYDDGTMSKTPIYFKKVWGCDIIGIFERYNSDRYWSVYGELDKKYLVYMPKLEYLSAVS